MSALSKIPQAAKAITAAVTGFGSAFALAYGDQVVTTAEWIQIAVATVLSGIAVFSVPNKADEGGDA